MNGVTEPAITDRLYNRTACRFPLEIMSTKYKLFIAFTAVHQLTCLVAISKGYPGGAIISCTFYLLIIITHIIWERYEQRAKP